MKLFFRPLPVWPHKPSERRRYSQFKASYAKTIKLLSDEVAHLEGEDVTIGVGLTERDIRRDGGVRANARSMVHPGVEISFKSKHGPLTYATDEFTEWEDNLRAIALSLVALRAVDRYGVSKRGQQYAGYALLAAGDDPITRGGKLVERYGGVKEALRHTHPDTGDTDVTADDYQAVLAYRAQQASA